MSNQLSIPFKKTSSIHIHQAVREYLLDHYPDTHPDSFKWDVDRWEQLRKEATGESVHISQTNSIIKYCAQMTFIMTKLPVDIGLDVQYSVALKPSSDWISLYNLAYERAAVMFNLAALYSQLALKEDRLHPDGIKRANALYQNAAGTLSHLISSALQPLVQSLDENTRVDDLNEPFLRSLEYLMLAQAQECTWQRAVIDHYKNGIIAKLAAKVASFYQLSASSARDAHITNALPTEWLAHIETKQRHFEAAAQYRKSIDDLESNKYGNELARLQEAKRVAKKGYDTARRAYVSKPVMDDLKSLLDILEKNILRAERDNDLIYHQDVLPISTLPSIQEVTMVQSTVPPGLHSPKDALQEDSVIFGELVGWGAKAAVAIYKDRVQNWLKEEVEDRVTDLDNTEDRILQTLRLPSSLDALDKPIGLPPSLLRQAEEVRLDDGPSRIDGSLENTEVLSQRCRDILNQAMDLLDQEASEDEGIRSTAVKDGRSWTRLPSYEANIELTNKEKRYRHLLDDAAEGDRQIRNKWEEWEESITQLTWDEEELERWVPSSTVSSLGQKDAAHVQTQTHARALRVHLEGLDDLRKDRAQFVQRAQRLAKADDIQPLILKQASSLEQWVEVEPAMFESILDEEISKYEKFKDSIMENAEKQSELLELVKARNEQFLQSRRDDQSVKDREYALQTLVSGYHKYREIIEDLNQGLKFYNDLAKIMTQFREACKEWVRTRRDEMRWLSHSLEALRIDEDDDPSTPRNASVMLHPESTPHESDPPANYSSRKSSQALSLPPPDSGEWEATPLAVLAASPRPSSGTQPPLGSVLRGVGKKR